MPARAGIEFGYVLHVSGGKGSVLDYRIEHPLWRRADGKVEPPCVGRYVIKQNDFDFYLGDRS